MADAHAPFEIPSFDTHPSRYRHWKLSVEGQVATLGMAVVEEGGLSPDYALKLNSYDLGVDIELADAIQRLRFEHPDVKVCVLTSLRERIFCAGANIFMLGMSSHAFKVNFCKFTNETRLGMEDASAHSGLRFLAALNGTASGGGYELALAADDIILMDDGNSAVSFPEVPLLAVLPGTGGLTRLTDKRHIRKDHADFFCTTAEGVRGKRAVQWGFVDEVIARSRWDDGVRKHVQKLSDASPRTADRKGITLSPVTPQQDGNVFTYRHVTLKVDAARRMADITVRAPTEAPPADAAAMHAQGADLWALRCFRDLDDALLRLRFQYLDVGTVSVRTAGDAALLRAWDQALLAHLDKHWFVAEVVGQMRRTLKRLDCTSRSFIALAEEGSCFVGSFLELALASDRTYALADPDEKVHLGITTMNAGPLTMGNGLTRLQTRFYGHHGSVEKVLAQGQDVSSLDAEKLGMVFAAPDDIDYPDEVRLCLEERASMSPDALTGMEASLRWAGPETMETRIFGRLSAWQNWIFSRPNATGEKGALTLYGKPTRAEFDNRRC
jgi:benzoyl-CoA-dihydrodiol lyase